MSKSDILTINRGDDIDSTSVELHDKETDKIKSFQERFRAKKEQYYSKKTPNKK